MPSHPSTEPAAPEVLKVGQVNRLARQLLEKHCSSLQVEGEISDFFCAASGHWYFTLKDEEAQLSCAMFRGDNRRSTEEPQAGDRVVLAGHLSLYEPRGRFQMIVSHMEAAGLGELQQAFEALRRMLAAEGLFDAARKQPLPDWPRHIALLTSPGGAAIRDVLSVLQRRCPLIPVTLVPTPVQGPEAVPGILAALELAGQAAASMHPPFDVILLTRGGGSLEDLQSFNEEQVVRAVAASPLPVVSAVGHEIDFTLTDLAADFRAPTPSAAAEQLSPERELLLAELAATEMSLGSLALKRIRGARERITWLRRRLRHPRERLQQLGQRTDELQLRLMRGQQRRRQQQQQRPASAWRALLQATTRCVRERQARLEATAAQLDLVSPLATLRRGYAAVTDSRSRIVRTAAAVEEGARVKARLGKGSLLCLVEERIFEEEQLLSSAPGAAEEKQ